MNCLFCQKPGKIFAQQKILFEKAGFTPQIAFDGEDLSIILQLVNEGKGISFIFKYSFLDQYLDNVKKLKISNPDCFQTVGITWDKRGKVHLS